MESADQPDPLPAAPSSIAYNGARHVLDRNWTGASTVPSRALYPHQWSWDSGFIAIGLRHLSPFRAQRELETLLTAQWDDGRIPHIVFNPAVPRRPTSPAPTSGAPRPRGPRPERPERWRPRGSCSRPSTRSPPGWCTGPTRRSRRRGFLRRVYPRLVAWQRYLTGRRDFGGDGLASIVHPWEPGMDNSPCWDGPLPRVDPAASGSFRRADLAHACHADRPTDLDYGRYVRLAENYRDHGYLDDDGVPRRSPWRTRASTPC